jgi:hypothetical protein
VSRAGEGVMGGLSVNRSLQLLWLAGVRGSHAPTGEAAQPLAAWLLQSANGGVDAIFFALGSTCFSWLLLRGRMIPAWLASTGVAASALLLVALPLQLAHVLTGSWVDFAWLPMALFELVLAIRLIARGAEPPARTSAA